MKNESYFPNHDTLIEPWNIRNCPIPSSIIDQYLTVQIRKILGSEPERANKNLD